MHVSIPSYYGFQALAENVRNGSRSAVGVQSVPISVESSLVFSFWEIIGLSLRYALVLLNSRSERTPMAKARR
jgi:hypothetical protein